MGLQCNYSQSGLNDTRGAIPLLVLWGSCSLQKAWLQLHNYIIIAFTLIRRIIKLFSCIAREGFVSVPTLCRLRLLPELGQIETNILNKHAAKIINHLIYIVSFK